MTPQEIEEMELKYLNKYYYFLKFAEDEMFQGFRTKEAIKDDWIGLYGREKLELNDEDLEIELELAMNSRLVDLEDTIDIKKVIHQL